VTEELNALYFRAFNTPDGARVLEDLQRKYRENTDIPKDVNQCVYERGQRCVIDYIERNVHKGGNLNDTGSTG
jgi:hypothetical protein